MKFNFLKYGLYFDKYYILINKFFISMNISHKFIIIDYN